MTKNYGKKTIWLDPDDVMEYGTDPETVRRYKTLDAEKARLKFYRISSKIFRYKKYSLSTGHTISKFS